MSYKIFYFLIIVNNNYKSGEFNFEFKYGEL